MERDHNKSKILNLLFILLFLTFICAAYFLQDKSYIARLYTGKDKGNLSIVVIGEPVLIITYDKDTKTVSLDNYTAPKPKKKQKNPPVLTNFELAQNALKAKNLDSGKVKYFKPREKDSAKVWNDSKHILASWRYNPMLLIPYTYGYIKTFAAKNTNIYPHEYMLLNLQAMNLEITDFVVKLASAKQNAQASKPAQAKEIKEKSAMQEKQTPPQERPLIIEIFNASGKKGMALELTQYLRGLNEKGLLKIDVLQYDNHHKQEEETKIVNLTGKVKEVKQLSLALGLRDTELFNETNPNAFCDVKIIIGKDFKMP